MVESTTVNSGGRLRRLAEGFLRWREASIILVTVGLVVYFQSATGLFFGEHNLENLSQFFASFAIIATGQVFLLVSGQIDLSVGNVFALAPFLVHFGVDLFGLPVIPAILLALIGCACIGAVNGIITVMLGVPSFVTTLGMLFVINGVTLITSGAFPVSIPEEARWIQPWLGGAAWAPIFWAMLVVLIFHIVLTMTRWGMHTFAVGGNPIGAVEAGIHAARVKIGNFMLCSTLGGLAGIIEAFRINTIDPSMGGTDTMFAAVAAAVIGGTPLAGGIGTVLGALVGAAMLGVLRVGLNLVGFSAYAFDLVIGSMIILAMVANVRLARGQLLGRKGASP